MLTLLGFSFFISAKRSAWNNLLTYKDKHYLPLKDIVLSPIDETAAPLVISTERQRVEKSCSTLRGTFRAHFVASAVLGEPLLRQAQQPGPALLQLQHIHIRIPLDEAQRRVQRIGLRA